MENFNLNIYFILTKWIVSSHLLIFFIQANYDTCSLDYYINSLINKTKLNDQVWPPLTNPPVLFHFLFGGGGGVESGSINSSGFSELMKVFGLHPTPTYIFLEGGKQILTPTQTTPLPLLHFFMVFLRWGKVRLGVDEVWANKIRKESIFPIYLHTCPQLSSTFLLKVGGFNLKCRLTDQIRSEGVV